MNPKDIVYKMVVLGRRLTTHFILDIFWGSSFMLPRAREELQVEKKPQERKTASHQERKSNWLAVFLSCGFFFLVRATHQKEQTFGFKFLIHD